MKSALKVFENLFSEKHFDFSSDMFFGSYLSLPRELDTEKINAFLLENQFSLAVPVYNSALQNYEYVAMTQSTELAVGRFNVREPLNSRVVESGEIDVALIPGVAFDKFGNRLGFGKGFYDFILKSLKPSAIKIGLAFDRQIFDGCLPKEPHDVAMDFVVSEKRVLNCNRNQPGIFNF